MLKRSPTQKRIHNGVGRILADLGISATPAVSPACHCVAMDHIEVVLYGR
jgi:hypothetical protein